MGPDSESPAKPEPSAPRCEASVATYHCTLPTGHAGNHHDAGQLLSPHWTDNYEREWKAKWSSSAPLDVGARRVFEGTVTWFDEQYVGEWWELHSAGAEPTSAETWFAGLVKKHVRLTVEELPASPPTDVDTAGLEAPVAQVRRETLPDVAAATPEPEQGKNSPEDAGASGPAGRFEPTDVDRRLDEVRGSPTLAERVHEWCPEASIVNAVKSLEAQVSQLTAALKDACDELDAWQRSREMDGGRVSNAEKQKLARCRAALAEPKWRADSARLGVTEAEVLKDLEKR